MLDLQGLGLTVAGGLIVEGARFIFIRLQERRGGYTGLWTDEIFDPQGEIVKQDRIVLKQRGERIKGDIERIFPENQTHRRWKMEGRIRGRNFFATFWSTDPSLPSHGCWYLHQVDDDKFSGYYLRLSEKNHKDIAPIHLNIFRER